MTKVDWFNRIAGNTLEYLYDRDHILIAFCTAKIWLFSSNLVIYCECIWQSKRNIVLLTWKGFGWKFFGTFKSFIHRGKYYFFNYIKKKIERGCIQQKFYSERRQLSKHFQCTPFLGYNEQDMMIINLKENIQWS